VGKTQLAKLLAHYVFGSTNHLITFDMSEYIEEHAVSRLLGAPPGYVGSEEEGRLTGAVKTTPFSMLLFDEIEKAHARIFDIFLPIFDEGRLKDSRGRDVSFKNCIIIMTSNIGADILCNADEANPRAALVEALRQHFRPEFINRIDDIIPFYPLLNEDVRAILRLEVNNVRRRLQDKQLRIRMFQRAYEYLMSRGYSPEFGARELRRIVDQEITGPISDMILRGKFETGDVINVMEEGGQLVFVKGDSERDEERRKRKDV
jgi:ATP-dependent Clp protease ATP-binding subunit ClpA